MSPAAELWELIVDTLKADPNVTALVDGIYDKVPAKPFKGKGAYISRGPFNATDSSADCINGQSITVQIDVWTQLPNRWECDNIVSAVRKSLHEQDLELTENALVDIRVDLTRVIDDPNPLLTHGILQVTAEVEEPETT